MILTANEIASLIEQSTVGAVPNEKQNIVHHANKIRSQKIGSELYSEGSKLLQSMIKATNPELGEFAIKQLNQTEIYVNEYPLINSIPNIRRQVKQIIIFDGMLQFIKYHTDLIWVLNLLQKHRSGVQYTLSDGSNIDECSLFALAGYSILSDYQMNTNKLIIIDDILGLNVKNHIEAALCGSLAFLALHELGHIELGHMKERVHSERQHFSLMENEALNVSKEQELAADRFAIDLIPSKSRASFMPSIIFLLGGFAFIEAFSGNLNEEYPLAANRLSCIVDQCEESPQNKQIITSWIESQRRSLLKFEALRKNNEGSIRNRIEESMPVYEAHYVIEEIKKRVLEQHGLLDIG